MTTIELPLQNEDGIFNVKLPVGEHILEVVAIDNLGKESDPVTVVILVEPDTGKEPSIDDFAPDWLGLGERTDQFLIRGERLRVKGGSLDGHSVEFLLGDKNEPDPNIEAKIKPQSTTKLLVVDVNATNAEAGPRTIRVSTPDGSSLASAKFMVQ